MRVRGKYSGQAQRSGSAVLIIILLLAIMLVYVLANLRALHYLSRELKLIDRRQVERWKENSAKTSTPETNRNTGVWYSSNYVADVLQPPRQDSGHDR
jgi:hypothetical protein